MARPHGIPSPAAISHFLQGLNWQGHIELPDGDVRWIADSIHALLTQADPRQCEGCLEIKLVVIRTKAGDFCEDCIEEMQEALDERRDA